MNFSREIQTAKGELMSKIKHTQFADYEDDNAMIDDDDFDGSGIELDAEDDDVHLSTESSGYKRSWRDTERYKEIRELYKLINDELYTGFNNSDFLDNDY